MLEFTAVLVALAVFAGRRLAWTMRRRRRLVSELEALDRRLERIARGY